MFVFWGIGGAYESVSLGSQDTLELILQPNLVSAILPQSPEFRDYPHEASRHRADCHVTCFRDPKGVLGVEMCCELFAVYLHLQEDHRSQGTGLVLLVSWTN